MDNKGLKCEICNGTGEVAFPFGEGTVNCINCNASLLNDWKAAVDNASLAAHTGLCLVPARVVLEIDRLWHAAETEVAAAKEEIVRLTAYNCKPDEEICELCQPLTDMHTRAEAAESSLSSERKETERLRGLLRSIACFRPHMGTPADMQAIAQQEFLETAALQSRQGEE